LSSDSTFSEFDRYSHYYPVNRPEANRMVIAMDMNSGKALDEECNQNNDAYNDEVLYAAWAEPRLETVVAAAYGKPASANLNGLMARLCACQG
jgi:hypothetical protein